MASSEDTYLDPLSAVRAELASPQSACVLSSLTAAQLMRPLEPACAAQCALLERLLATNPRFKVFHDAAHVAACLRLEATLSSSAVSAAAAADTARRLDEMCFRELYAFYGGDAFLAAGPLPDPPTGCVLVTDDTAPGCETALFFLRTADDHDLDTIERCMLDTADSVAFELAPGHKTRFGRPLLILGTRTVQRLVDENGAFRRAVLEAFWRAVR